MADRSSPTITGLQAEFEAFFNDGVFDRGRQSLKHLRAHANEPLKLLLGTLGTQFGFFDRDGTPSPRELAGALDQSDLHAELQRRQKENHDELRGMGNRLVRQHPALLGSGLVVGAHVKVKQSGRVSSVGAVSEFFGFF